MGDDTTGFPQLVQVSMVMVEDQNDKKKEHIKEGISGWCSTTLMCLRGDPVIQQWLINLCTDTSALFVPLSGHKCFTTIIPHDIII